MKKCCVLWQLKKLITHTSTNKYNKHTSTTSLQVHKVVQLQSASHLYQDDDVKTGEKEDVYPTFHVNAALFERSAGDDLV